jgi:hypothetical protein
VWRAAVLALVACAGDGAEGPQASGLGPPVAAAPHAELAFVHANVIGMETAEVARDRTVLIDHGAVVAIGDMAPPAGAQVIEARGKYLIPGLHDMHVHLDGTRGMLELFVLAGVTTVRNMAGNPRVLALRERVARGELLGPAIYTAGPFVDGAHPRWEASDVVAQPEDAERVIAAQAAAGYDFVKVYNGLTLPAYDAVAAAARAHHLRVVGHVPFAVPLAHALATEQASIEHLSGYVDAIERPDSPVRGHHTGTGILRGWLYADPARIAEVAAETARHGVWSCPTLVTSVAYGELWRGRIPEAGELDAVSPDWLARWDPARSPRRTVAALRQAMEQVHDRELDGEFAVVRELAAAGAPLLAGTDTPNPYVVPGASLHQELALLAAAGLSPYAALRAATIDAADFLGDARDGRIAPGARADLVMLAADPLADLRALDHIEGVVVRGRWLSADELRARHDALVAGYRAPTWLAPVELPDAAGRAIRYVVADNGTPVGAYAMARHAGELVERQTLEDETITARTRLEGDGARALVLDIDRAAGARHAEHAARAPLLVGWLAPATAASLVEPLALAESERLVLSVAEPDRDAPEELHPGELSVTRQPDGEGGAHVYRLHLTVDHGNWTARLVLDLDGIPRELRVTDASRPVVRTWKRQR